MEVIVVVAATAATESMNWNSVRVHIFRRKRVVAIVVDVVGEVIAAVECGRV